MSQYALGKYGGVLKKLKAAGMLKEIGYLNHLLPPASVVYVYWENSSFAKYIKDAQVKRDNSDIMRLCGLAFMVGDSGSYYDHSLPQVGRPVGNT